MELIDRVREALKREFGTETDEELLEAVRTQPELDLGIFITPLSDIGKAGAERAS